MKRRNFLKGLIAAPMIVKASSLMPIDPRYQGTILRPRPMPNDISFQELYREEVRKGFEQAHALAREAVMTVDPAKPGSEATVVVGYDKYKHVTWMRVSRDTPDGREWHDVVQRTGNHTADPVELKIMEASSEAVYRRSLREHGFII